MDLVLSKDFINKLSNNDVNSICTFLKSLKHVADNHEIEKQLQLEKKKIQPVYTIINDEIIDVTGIKLLVSYLSKITNVHFI